MSKFKQLHFCKLDYFCVNLFILRHDT